MFGKKKRKNNDPKINPASDKKRADFGIEPLEKRVLLSASWVDADTGEMQDGPGHGDDHFQGSDLADVANGGGGNDLLEGNGGDDILSGSDGQDTLLGGEGNDTLDGGTGSDVIDGGAGDDIIEGGDDNDIISGGSGDDTITDTSGHDTVDAGAGNDTVDVGSGDDVVTGGLGNDTVDLGTGHDTFNYTLGDGSDVVVGDGGTDTIVINGVEDTEAHVLVEDGATYSARTGDTVDADRVVVSINGVKSIEADGVEQITFNAANDADTIETSGNFDGTGFSSDGITVNDPPERIEASDDGTEITGTSGDDVIDVADYGPGSFDMDSAMESDGAISHWRFEAGAVVDSISGHDGSYVNGASGADSGVDADGKAAHFNGGNDYIEIPHHADYETDNGTIQMWFNPDDTSGTQTLISKDSTDFDNGGHITIKMVGDDLEVRLQSDDNSYFVRANDAVSAGEWNHVAFSFGEDGMKLYVNGELADTEAYTGGLSETSGGTGNEEPWVLGANAWKSGDEVTNNLEHYYAGQIDHVAFSGQALEGEAIAEIYSGGTSETQEAGTLDHTVDSGAGNDTITGGSGNDNIEAGEGNDDVTAGAGDDVVHGREGDDVISGGAGNDSLHGGHGADTISGGEGDDSITGGHGDDVITGGSGADTLGGGQGADTITGGEGSDTMTGGDGDDVIYAGDGETAPVTLDAVLESDSTVSHWRFDGDGVVDTVSSHDGAYSNGAIGGESGVDDSARAAHFDGGNDYVEIPHHADYETDSGTIQMWFNPDDTSGTQTLVSKDSNGFDDGGHLTMRMIGDDLEVRFQSDSDSYTLTAENVVTAGEWNHVAFSFGEGGMQLFVNGELADTNAYEGGMGATSGGTGNEEPWVLGANQWTSGNQVANNLTHFFGGSMDHVAFSGEALDPADIQAIYATGTGDAATVAHADSVSGGDGFDTVSYQDAGAGVDIDLTTGTATGETEADTLDSIEGAEGSNYDDTFSFENAADGALYIVDGADGQDSIDLSGYSSESVTFEDGQLTVSTDAGTFVVEYTNVESIQFSDADAVVAQSDISGQSIDGPTIVVDGADVVRVDAGAESASFDYDTDTNTISVSLEGATGEGAELEIETLAGSTSIGAIEIDADITSITLDSDVESITIAADAEVPTITVAGGDGSIGELNLGDGSSYSGGDVIVNADVGSLEMGGLESGVVFNGDVGSVSSAGTMTSSSSFSVNGNAGEISVTGDVAGEIEVTGNLTSLNASDDIEGNVTVGGDVESIQAGDDIKEGSQISVSGSVGTIAVGDVITNATIEIDGDLGSVTAPNGIHGGTTIEVHNVQGQFDLIDDAHTEGEDFGQGADIHYDGDTDTLTVVSRVNSAPTDIQVAGGTVSENADAGTVVASITVVDVNDGDGHTFELVDNADGLFEIDSDGQIVVADGADLDYEASDAHQVTVRVTDESGETYEEVVDISVANVIETLVVTGNQTLSAADGPYENVVINGGYIEIDGNAVINGDLTIESAAQINGGELQVTGDVTTTDTNYHGSATIVLSGDGAQTISTGDGTGELNNVSIENASGQVTIEGDLQISGTYTDNGNTVDASGSTLEIQGNASVSASGTSFGDVTINGDYLEIAELHVDGDLTLEKAARINGGEIQVTGNVTTTDTNYHGSATIVLSGDGAQTISTGDGTGELNNVSIENASGQVTIEGDLEISGNYTDNGNTVDASGSTLEIQGNASVSASGTSFGDVTINGDYLEIAELHVDGDLTLEKAARINGGEIQVTGNVTTTDTNYHGSATIVLSGDGAQTISTGDGTGELNNVSIENASGQVTIEGDLEISGTYADNGNTVDASGSTLEIQGNANVSASGTSFSDVTINGDYLDIAELHVDGDLTLEKAARINGGEIQVTGNVTTTDTNYHGSATIVLSGDGAQTISTGAGTGELNNVSIENASGQVTIEGDLEISGTYADNGNTVDASGSTLEIQGNASVSASGTSFGDVTINGDYLDIAELHVDGDLTLEKAARINGGEIQVTGNVTTTDTNYHGSATIVLSGDGAQTISTGDGTGELNNVSIENASGQVTIEGDLQISGNYTDNGNTVDATGATVEIEDGATVSASGTTFQNVSFNGSYMEIEGDMYVSGDLEIEKAVRINGGVIYVAGEVIDTDGNWYGSLEIRPWTTNEAPTDITLDGGAVVENAPGGTTVGQINVTDANEGDTHTFELVDDADGRFVVDGDGVITVAEDAMLDYETDATHEVTVRVTDSEGATYEESVEIAVNDLDEAPVIEPAADITVNDGDMVTLSVNVRTADGIDFESTDIDSYGGADQDKDLTVEVEGDTLSMTGNGWKSVDHDYTVTENTVLEFQFKVDAEGEIHGIGFDTDSSINPTTTFRLHGTQDWGIDVSSDYDGHDGEWVTYRINVGEHFQGDFDKLVFVSDQDAGDADASSQFRGVRVYEADHAIVSTDDLSYTWEQVSGPEVTLDDPHAPEPTFESPPVGEDTDIVFRVTVANGEHVSTEDLTVHVNTYNSVPEIDAGEDLFVAERAPVQLGVEVNDGPESIDFESTDIDSYGGADQDKDLTVEVEGDTLSMTGNGWKSVDHDYTVTENTVLEFQFKVDAEGEIHGIGFDTDSSINPTTTFRLHGTQDWGIDVSSDYDGHDGEWVTYRINVGEHFQGDFDKLVFVSDQDAGDADASSQFRGVKIYENDAGQTQSENLSYEWEQVSGPAVELDDPNAVNPTFEAPTVDSDEEVVFKVTVRDGEDFRTDEVTVHVAAVNDAPTDITFTGGNVDENAPAGTVVATASVVDVDGVDTHAYELIGDADGRFVIDADGNISVAEGADLNHETGDSHEVTVRVTDSEGESVEQTLEITVGDVNEAPTLMELDHASVSEGVSGAVVGRLGVVDPDANDHAGYAVSDSRFEVTDDGLLKLRDGVSLDHEEAGSIELEIVGSDSAGNAIDAVFTIQVEDINEGPSAIEFTGGAVSENAPAGTVVAQASVTDADAGDSHTFELTDDAGGRFTIDADGNIAVAEGADLDHETLGSHEVTVRVTDSGGNTLDKVVEIAVEDVNEAPISVAISEGVVEENAEPGTVVASVAVMDADEGETFTFSLVDDAGGRFTIDGDGNIVVAPGADIDYESSDSLTVRVLVTDSAGHTIEESVEIQVTNVNEPEADTDEEVIEETEAIHAQVAQPMVYTAESDDMLTSEDEAVGQEDTPEPVVEPVEVSNEGIDTEETLKWVAEEISEIAEIARSVEVADIPLPDNAGSWGEAAFEDAFVPASDGGDLDQSEVLTDQGGEASEGSADGFLSKFWILLRAGLGTTNRVDDAGGNAGGSEGRTGVGRSRRK